MMSIGGLIPAVVQSREPDDQGRVQVSFPDMPEITDFPWAPIAMPMTGAGRGFYFMPEKDDEVIVGFDRGDFEFPYVLGFLWNGVDTPPTDGINAKVRRFQSVRGHQMDFDDNSGAEQIRIRSQGGHLLHLSDSESKIHIKSNNGLEVILDDSASNILLKNGQTSITLNPASIELKATEITIDASSQLTVKGNPVHLNP